MPERRYQMIRLEAGDYLLPSNDLETLWRVYSYTEDGSLSYIDGGTGKERYVTGTFWATAKYNRGRPRDAFLDAEILEWHVWDTWETGLRSRSDALDAALSCERSLA